MARAKKAKDKTIAAKANFKPAKNMKEEKPEKRVFSGPAHVSEIRTTSGCRFGG